MLFDGLKCTIHKADALDRLKRRREEAVRAMAEATGAIRSIAATTTHGENIGKRIFELATALDECNHDAASAIYGEAESYHVVAERRALRWRDKHVAASQYLKRVEDAMRIVDLATPTFEVDAETITFLGD